MTMARITEQLVFSMPAKVGLLADLAEAVGNAGTNVLALLAYENDGMGQFAFVTSDNDATAAALRSFGCEPARESVVAIDVPNEPGALASAARAIAGAGINVLYVYGTTSQGPTATVYVKTVDDEAAVDAIG